MKKFGRSILFLIIAVIYWIGVFALGASTDKQIELVAAIILTIIFSIIILFTKKLRTVGIGIMNLIGAAVWIFIIIQSM